MKNTKSLWILLLLAALSLVIVLASCKTEREQSDLGPHPAGWMDTTSATFHGYAALRDSSNSCRACHGQDLRGGTSGRSCYDCHTEGFQNFPHPAGWADTTSGNFHGTVAKQDSSRSCAFCHGSNFDGGFSGVSCRPCHAPYPHINMSGWQEPVRASDPTFHGWRAMADSAGPGEACTHCHGADFRGTNRANSCYDCHNVLHTTVENEDTDTHRAFVASKGWKITAICAVCHGADFAGGAAAGIDDAAECTQCHNPGDDVMKLTGCNVCHTTEPELRPFWKVPFGMDSAAAGAHPTHVTVNGFSCRECHPSLAAAGHPHQLPADVSFERAMLADTFGMQPTAVHVGVSNSGNAQCSNVYCHSNGVHPNPGPPVVTFPQWRQTLHCGACHGIPPTAAENPNHPTHSPGAHCSGCHSDVDPNSNFSIPDSIRFIADSLHVDGSYHL